MKIFKIFALLLTMVINSFAQVSIDENFDDWESLTPLYIDSTGDGGSIEFYRLWLSDDEKFLYYCFETGSEINLQELNDITLYLDLDNNNATGKSVNGIGAELEYTFGDRGGKIYVNGGSLNISHPDLFLITAPTVTSSIFEGVIKKDLSSLGLSFNISDSIAVVLKDGTAGDMIPEAGEILYYSQQNIAGEYFTDYSIKKQDDNFLRFMTYNVERDGITDIQKREYFKRMLSVIDPDIIAFQEIYNSNSQTIATLVNSFYDDGRSYYHAKQGSDNIVLSKFPITASFQIPAATGLHQNGAFIVDMSEKYGKQALVISAHTPCCSNNDGRQDEIDAIMAFVRDAKNDGGTITLEEGSPIFIAGDMNLVGYNRQLKTFLTGDIFNNSSYGPDFAPDWDGSDFEDSKPGNPNLPLYFTWYDEGSDYSPGRLDFIIYPGSVLEKVNSFTMYTPSMPADTLNTYGLNQNDAINAADHNPVIADFKLEIVSGLRGTGNTLNPEQLKLFQNYPNPFNPSTIIDYELNTSSDVNFNLISVTGEIVETSELGFKNQGRYSLKIDLSKFNSGVYFYQLVAGSDVLTKKMLLIK